MVMRMLRSTILPMGFCVSKEFNISEYFSDTESVTVFNIHLGYCKSRKDIFSAFCNELGYEGHQINSSWDAFYDVMSYMCIDQIQGDIHFMITGFENIININSHDAFTLVHDLSRLASYASNLSRKIINSFVTGNGEGFHDFESVIFK